MTDNTLLIAFFCSFKNKLEKLSRNMWVFPKITMVTTEMMG